MKKVEFAALYNQIEQMCGGSQDQARVMLSRVRRGIPLHIVSTNIRDCFDIKNGANIYRTIFLLETYVKHGTQFEAAARSGMASIHHWHREKGNRPVLPLQESEIIAWERKGEVA